MTYRRSKYGAKKTLAEGLLFDSKAEAARYLDLRLMERAGEIKRLSTQPRYALAVNGVKVCDYIADFSYHRVTGKDATAHVLEDVKGARTGAAWAMFRIKAKLFRAIYGYEIEVYPPVLKAPRRKAKR